MKDEDMNQALEDLMERFRNGDVPEEHSKDECAAIMQDAIKHAKGEINIKVKRRGDILKMDMHTKGNPAALLVAAYCLMDRVREDSPGITFEDIIEMMRYMEAKKNE